MGFRLDHRLVSLGFCLLLSPTITLLALRKTLALKNLCLVIAQVSFKGGKGDLNCCTIANKADMRKRVVTRSLTAAISLNSGNFQLVAVNLFFNVETRGKFKLYKSNSSL